MVRGLLPEHVDRAIEKGQPAPFYLFQGPNTFLMERALEKLKKALLPDSARDFNMEVFYGGESTPAEIVASARSIPFLATNRLIIVRRTESFRADELGHFLPYLENPVKTTCLVFIAAKGDFKKGFFKTLKSAGRVVSFEELRESRIVPWLREAAAELGLKLNPRACLYLQQVVGNNLADLYGELEKIRVRYGGEAVGMEELKDMVIHSRSFTIFELVNVVSRKDHGAALAALNRFLEEEDKKNGPLRVIGMLNRQLRLIWETKAVLERGGKKAAVAERLGAARFSADEFLVFARKWSAEELERGLAHLYRADGLLKSGSPGKLVLENLVLSLGREASLG